VEQRHFQRKRLAEPIGVIDSRSGKEIGQLLDLSQAGFMLAAPVELELNHAYRLQLPLFTDLNGGDVPIELVADALWCEASSSGRQYWHGFQIKAITAEGREYLMYFLQQGCLETGI
jgi:hypothetical protein